MLQCVFFASLDVEVGVLDALRHRLSGQSSEAGVDARHHLLCFNVTHQYKYHVFGHIPCFVELHQLAQLWVLQVFGQADDGARVGVSGKYLLQHKLALSARFAVLRAVILFVHILQLRLERAEHGVQEALRRNFQPLVHLIRRETAVIVSIVVACTGIYTCSTDAFHQVRVFVRQAKFTGFYAQFVNLLAQCLALGRVGFGCQKVVLGNDFLVKRLFLCPVQRTNQCCTFEHYVLQVVSQSGIVAWFVDRTCSYTNQAEHVRFRFIFPNENRKAVA